MDIEEAARCLHEKYAHVPEVLTVGITSPTTTALYIYLTKWIDDVFPTSWHGFEVHVRVIGEVIT